MSLEKKIEEKLNESLKNKDKSIFPTLRLIISAIKDFKIASKIREGSLKDPEVITILKKMNKQTTYHNNGNKCEKGFCKDGRREGLWESWYENGEKKREVTFKDGKEISKEQWNEDGSVKE